MQRIKRFGTIDQKSGESIIYGTYREPIDLVMGMYIDDGVEDRIHRKHLMSEKFTVTGVAHCNHYTRFKEMV